MADDEGFLRGLEAAYTTLAKLFKEDNRDAQLRSLSKDASADFFNGSRNGSLRCLRAIKELLKDQQPKSSGGDNG